MTPRRRVRAHLAFASLLALALAAPAAFAAQDGFLHVDGKTLFPIGFYATPADDTAYADMAAAGVNLVRCGSAADLDRAGAHGMYGWITLPMQAALTPEAEQRIAAVVDHPALAVWEGPDEMVWNFTAYSGLARNGTHERPGAWWDQTPKAVAYAKDQAATIMPNVHQWAARIRELDTKQRPIWFNEAYQSDTIYMRQYLDAVDITGCDLYPVKAASREIANIADSTERFNRVGAGKPVWMVLQAFSWHELKEKEGQNLAAAYPTFAESRFMAWDAIAHGAKGILYWGSAYTKNEAFVQSLYAVTRELAALQPLLAASDPGGMSIQLIEAPTLEPQRGVAGLVRVNTQDGLVVLVNEDDTEHMGVEVGGLARLDGRTLHLLYGDETVEMVKNSFVTRMQPFEVKVFATTNAFESERTSERSFGKE